MASEKGSLDHFFSISKRPSLPRAPTPKRQRRENTEDSDSGRTSNSHQPDVPSEKVVLVYFLGGCTYAEMAALRLLGKIKGYHFIFAMTAITNGADLVGSLNDGKK